MAKDQTPSVDPTDDASALSDISGIASELAKAGKDAEKASALVDEIMDRINTLDEDAQARLMSRPVMQKLLRRALEVEHPPAKTDLPGTIYYKTLPGGDKTPWDKKPTNWSDLYNPSPPRKPMPLKTWTPSKTTPLGFKGLLVTVNAHEEVTLPEVFYGIWQDHLRNEKLKEQHAAYLMKKGAVPQDPSIVTVDGARARALANHDGAQNIYQPGGGIIADWTPDLMRESA